MYKFFLPILIFLVGLWIYVGVYENGRKKTEDEAKRILALYEDYEKINDSISKLPTYADFTKIKDKGFTCLIPSDLTTTNNLSEYAAKQFMNKSKEFYLILNHEKVGDYYYALKDYVNYCVSGIRGNLNNYLLADSSYVSLNNGAVYKLDILGDYYDGQYNLPLKYKVIITEHEDYFYILKIWTIQEFFQNNNQDMDRIISSVTFMPDINKAKENIY